MGAMENVFTNVIEGSCGFHITFMGWKRHVPGVNTISKPNQNRWKEIVNKIHKWIYSWMEPNYCCNEEEYKISKYLLIQFICSPAVLSAAENHIRLIKSILNFLKGYVWIYEDMYLYYLRRGVRNFHTAHSSAHEGTNLGLKE